MSLSFLTQKPSYPATPHVLVHFSMYFFKQAGMATDVTFNFSISLYGVAMIGVVISWFTITYLGRRTIFLTGLSCNFLMFMTINFASLAPQTTKGPAYAAETLLLVFTLVYDITVGTVAYSTVAEIPSDRLRTKTIVLARNLYNVMGTIGYMLNPSAWHWRGKAGFFWAGLCFLCLVWNRTSACLSRRGGRMESWTYCLRRKSV
jgi:SP family general alpha glucoside:H+ symporter-like MFS transporter